LKFDQTVLDWLLEPDQPSVRYYALLDLLDYSPSDREVKETHSKIAERGWARDTLAAQEPGGYWVKRDSLYIPKYLASNWRAIVLSDFGLTAKNVQVNKASGLFFEDWLGAKLKEEENEACITGNLARFLTRFGFEDHPDVKKLFDWLVRSQIQDGGWHCFLPSKSGTLDCWEPLLAFSYLPRQKWTKGIQRSAEKGIEFYLDRNLFKEGPRYSPWFRFHYPNHYYYDILVGLDTVTRIRPGPDKRLEPALRILKDKRRQNGKWNLDAVHPDIGRGAHYRLRRKVRPLAFEKPGQPSKWITLTALRVLKRVEE
jgi:hypothetical protein